MKKLHKLTNPNPLNFFEARQVQVLPPHFESVAIGLRLYNLEDSITKWITDNLSGRFYVGSQTILDTQKQKHSLLDREHLATVYALRVFGFLWISTSIINLKDHKTQSQ